MVQKYALFIDLSPDVGSLDAWLIWLRWMELHGFVVLDTCLFGLYWMSFFGVLFHQVERWVQSAKPVGICWYIVCYKVVIAACMIHIEVCFSGKVGS